MKLSKLLVEQLVRRALKSYVFEAEEKEEAPKDDASDDTAKDTEEENPFAGSEDSGGDEAEKDDAKGEPAKPAGIPLKFNMSAVKKYNDAEFLSDTGVVKSIDKRGIIVTTQPDQVDILVNFNDISENVKKFFKKR
jgi:hypothetical protein